MENLNSFARKSYITKPVVKRNREREAARILEYLPIRTLMFIFFYSRLACMENINSFERKSYIT